LNTLKMANAGGTVAVIEVIHTFVKTDVEAILLPLRFRIEPENVLGSVGRTMKYHVWHGSNLYVVREDEPIRDSQRCEVQSNQLVDQSGAERRRRDRQSLPGRAFDSR
jgi:hypothetical protein